LFTAPEQARVACASVTFEPRARSALHTHPLDQILVGTAGCGWTQCEDGPIEEIRAEDVIHCPLGHRHRHRHRHGATATISMTRSAIRESLHSMMVEGWSMSPTRNPGRVSAA
jgi:quercetin dioxygenase-like cupin family protein